MGAVEQTQVVTAVAETGDGLLAFRNGGRRLVPNVTVVTVTATASAPFQLGLEFREFLVRVAFPEE